MAKNMDYTNSAESLTNPESVRLLLLKRLGLNSKIAELQKELAMRNVDLLGAIRGMTEILAANESEIRNAVQDDGGYQDLDAGLYALRQKRVSYTYDPAKLKREYPAFVSLTIKEIVDTTAIAKLIKGGMLDMAALERDLVAVSSVSFAFILKADSAPVQSEVEVPEAKKDLS